MPQNIIYKTKFVAFIDLLGFHQIIEKSAQDHCLQKRVSEVLQTFQNTACENPQQDIVLTVFSDSLVLSAAVTSEGFNSLCDMIGRIARNLIQKDILIRGGISVGLVHHQGTMTFGPAMNEAYGIEDKWAVYPAVILSESVAAQAKAFASDHVCQDPHRPHLMMVDYLKPMRIYTQERAVGKALLDGPSRLIVRNIQVRLRDHRSNLNLYSKAQWIEAYWNSAVSELGVLPTTFDDVDMTTPAYPLEESTVMVQFRGQRIEMKIEGQSLPPKS